MTNAEKAYAEAERMFAEAKMNGTSELKFDTPETHALTHLPPQIAELTGLRVLDLHNTQITDAGLAQISGLTGLRVLDLHNTQITDAGLAQISGLAGLQALTLSYTQITDAGLAQISGLTRLRALILDHTQITDAGLAQISGLTGLEALNLSNTQITDAGLAQISGLTRLRALILSGTQITDAGLAQISGMTELDWLGLENTAITDLRLLRGFEKLATDPFLGGLEIKNTAAARADARIAEIAEIEDNKTRARALFDLIDAGWAPPIQDEQIPKQRSTGFRFRLNAQGMIVYDNDAPNVLGSPQMADLHKIICSETGQLLERCGQGDNQPYYALSLKLGRYRTAAADCVPNLQVISFWNAGNKLRVLLRHNADRMLNSLDGMPRLTEDLRDDLESLMSVHNVFSALHPELAAYDAAQIDTVDRHTAQQNHALFQAAIDAFAVQTRLIVEEITTDLRALHDEATGENQAAYRALKLEQDGLYNLIMEVLAQGVIEAKSESFFGKVGGDVRSHAVSAAIGGVTVMAGPTVAATFPQLIVAIQPQVAALLAAWHGQDYDVKKVVDWIVWKVKSQK